VTTPVVTGWRAVFTDARREWLWAQLGVATVTLVFALAFSTSMWRSLLYGITGPLGAVLMWYGIVGDAKWALIVAGIGQLFGITTAAAKTVQRSVSPAA
jgi:hypothetical protein